MSRESEYTDLMAAANDAARQVVVNTMQAVHKIKREEARHLLTLLTPGDQNQRNFIENLLNAANTKGTKGIEVTGSSDTGA